jgi:ubiquinone/menaquinone biosynthesis C-methylase UbiE
LRLVFLSQPNQDIPMTTTQLFDEHVAEYEAWFERYQEVFQSEIEAVREMLPEGDKLLGIEVGLGTGRYSQALNIRQGIEPAARMRNLAIKRGIETMDASAEKLPYGDLRFDFVLMLFSIAYFKNLPQAFQETYRVLKNDGVLLIGFIDKDSTIGKAYETHKPESTFYKQANFYSVEKVVRELTEAGFRHFDFRQTLFGELDSILTFQPSKEGYGEGSFIVVSAYKKFAQKR